VAAALAKRAIDGVEAPSPLPSHALLQLPSLHKQGVTNGNKAPVLSRLLALRNTVLGEVYKGRSRLSKCEDKLIMDFIWFKVKKQLNRERVCIA
jgi:hypothetical protein